MSRTSQYGLCSKVEIRVVFLSVFVSGAFFCFFFRGTNVLEEFRVVLPYFWRFLLHWVSEVTLVFVREGVPAWFLLCLRGFDFVFLLFLVLLWT